MMNLSLSGLFNTGSTSSAINANSSTSLIHPGHVDLAHLMDLENQVIHEIDFAGGRGDFKLIAKHDGSESALVSFLVSSSAMILACKPWARMLRGKFRNGRAGSLKILDFTEDNHLALRILVDITHLRFSRVPCNLKLADLAEVAILTDKYDLTDLAAPWVKGWAEQLYPSIEEKGNESHWLRISWEYGFADTFHLVSSKICMGWSLVGAGMQGSCSGNGVSFAVDNDGIPISDDLPPGIEGGWWSSPLADK
jgi:hypothetical protein